MMKSKSCIIMKSLRKGRRKLGGNRGVTLVEMLLCVLILLLSTGVTVSTLDLSITHFKARTRETEQLLLCNTLSLAAQEYLTYANKLELDNSTSPPTLTRFKTGANSALESRWCEFVTRYYDENNQLVTSEDTEDNPGQICMRYYIDTDPRYYALADKSQYIVKKNAPDDVKLEAAIKVEVDQTNKRFNVTITVQNREGLRTQEAKNEFIVIPINPDVIPDP